MPLMCPKGRDSQPRGRTYFLYLNWSGCGAPGFFVVASALGRGIRSFAGVSGFAAVELRNLEARERSVLVLSKICYDRREIVSLENLSALVCLIDGSPNSHATTDQWAMVIREKPRQGSGLLEPPLFPLHYLVRRRYPSAIDLEPPFCRLPCSDCCYLD